MTHSGNIQVLPMRIRAAVKHSAALLFIAPDTS